MKEYDNTLSEWIEEWDNKFNKQIKEIGKSLNAKLSSQSLGTSLNPKPSSQLGTSLNSQPTQFSDAFKSMSYSSYTHGGKNKTRRKTARMIK